MIRHLHIKRSDKGAGGYFRIISAGSLLLPITAVPTCGVVRASYSIPLFPESIVVLVCMTYAVGGSGTYAYVGMIAGAVLMDHGISLDHHPQ